MRRRQEGGLGEGADARQPKRAKLAGNCPGGGIITDRDGFIGPAQLVVVGRGEQVISLDPLGNTPGYGVFHLDQAGAVYRHVRVIRADIGIVPAA